MNFDEFMQKVLRGQMAAPTDASRGEIEEYLGVRFGHEWP